VNSTALFQEGLICLREFEASLLGLPDTNEDYKPQDYSIEAITAANAVRRQQTLPVPPPATQKRVPRGYWTMTYRVQSGAVVQRVVSVIEHKYGPRALVQYTVSPIQSQSHTPAYT